MARNEFGYPTVHRPGGLFKDSARWKIRFEQVRTEQLELVQAIRVVARLTGEESCYTQDKAWGDLYSLLALYDEDPFFAEKDPHHANS
jgi:hypothetical protein